MSNNLHSSFFLLTEQFSLDQWNQADSYTQQAFPWLPDMKDILGKTYCQFCLSYPPDSLIDATPSGYDTYVMHFGTEYVDWHWVKRFCQRFPDSRVVLISFFNTALYAEPNLQLLQFDVWPHIMKWYTKEHDQSAVKYQGKTKKISSLANRVSQFRAYVCAHLHKTWNPADYLVSWRGYVFKPEDLFLLNLTGNTRVDETIDYLKSTFFDLRIAPDGDFVNRPMDNLYYDWSAYTDCVINCSNESVNTSFQSINGESHIVPGPYFTEKTWKCFLSGTALLPIGQYQTYEYLGRQGFKFDYPWDCSFDQIPGDLDRIAKVLDCLDSIKDMPLDFLTTATQASNQHNREHILSGNYFDQVEPTNLNNVQTFIANFK